MQKFLEFGHISDEWYDTDNHARSEIVALVINKHPVKQLHVVRGTRNHCNIFASQKSSELLKTLQLAMLHKNITETCPLP